MVWQTILIVVGCVILAVPLGILLGRKLAKSLPGRMLPGDNMASEDQQTDQEMPKRAAYGTLARAAEEARLAEEAILKVRRAKQAEASQTGLVASQPVPWTNISKTPPSITEKPAVTPARADSVPAVASMTVPPSAKTEKIPAVGDSAVPQTAKVESVSTVGSKTAPQSAKLSAKFRWVLDEMRQNLDIARSSRPGTPVSFKIEALNLEMEELERLPVDVTNDIKEVYTDINLANNIVWLFQEVSGKSKDLESSYIKLCGKIAERLTHILARLE